MSVDLPAPDGPTMKTKSPSGARIDLLEGRFAVRIDLRDILQDEYRLVGGGLVAAAPEQAAAGLSALGRPARGSGSR